MNPTDCLAATAADSGITAIVLVVAAVLILAGIAVVVGMRSSTVRRGPAIFVIAALAAGLALSGTIATSTPALAAAGCETAPTAPPAPEPTGQPTPSPTPTSTPTQTPPPSLYAGSWTGEVNLEGFIYTVNATITDNGNVASGVASYPGLCTSTWSQTARDATSITMLETIDQPYDPLFCTDGGIITLTPSGSPLGTTLDWYYVYSTGPGPYDQSTTLTRVP